MGRALTADAVVIGTGAAGGPVAAVLAEAGRDVIVLEAGPRVGADELTGDEAEMTTRLYTMNAAADSGLAFYGGTCVGGSTLINDALCLRPPPEILHAWRTTHGLAVFDDAAFAPFVDRAWAEVHATPTGPANLNRNAHRLARGATRLGWVHGAMARNVHGCVNLGLCNLGCPVSAKQSTLLTHVPRAERAGARVLDRTRAERIELDAGRVIAVDARRDGEVVRVRTPLVCVAAGVLGTGPLLLRSGVPAGDGLQVHTSVHVSARFREPVHAYFGPTMSWAVHELSDVGGHTGPGAMIESVAGHPLVTAPTIPGFGATHEAVMRQLPHLARALVVVRDRTRGRIDAAGALTYPLLSEDVERLRAGIIGAARVYLAAGALEVHVPVHGVRPVRGEHDLDALATMPLAPSRFALVYAVHLFGGAVMAGPGREAVCDATGAVRGARGLYVCDAAGLPGNTGVNPQITIMANAIRIATGIVEDGA